MKFEDVHRFDKPFASVMRMFSDRRYFERKYEALGDVKDFEILECETTGNRFRIKHRSQQRSDIPLPDFAKKFIGEYNTVIQQDSWDLVTGVGRLEIEIKGVPLRISADMKVADGGGKGGNGSGTNTFNWNVSCSIPLLGGKLEKLIAEDIRAKSASDARLSNQLLKDY